MRREILMPPVIPSMTDAKVARWHVAEGQDVAAGDLLVEVTTSTATFDIEAEDEGRLERILVPAGTEGVKVNTPIAILFGRAREAHARSSAEPQPQVQPLAFAGLEPLAAYEAPPPVPRADIRHERTYREALRDALAAEMRADPSVFLIGVDVAQNRGAPRVAQGLADEFGPDRVVSAPALDEAALGTALGAAFAGLRPVVELSHWGRALETLAPYLRSAAETHYLSGGRLAAPIVFRGPNGYVPGMTGEGARCVASVLAQIPGLKVVQPATAATANALLRAAIRDSGPVAVLEDERLYALRRGADSGLSDVTALGTARVVRPGRDLTITAAGHALVVALEAARTLARDGIEAEVLDLMCVRPLDREAIAASVTRTGRLLTVEEGWGDLGLGTEIIASTVARAFAHLKSPPARLAAAGVPMPYAVDLQALALPGAAEVVDAARTLMQPSDG